VGKAALSFVGKGFLFLFLVGGEQLVDIWKQRISRCICSHFNRANNS